MPDRGARLMAATFNAPALPGSAGPRTTTTRPAAAAAGGAAPSSDVGAGAAVSAHEAMTDPHPQYLTAAEGAAAFDALGAAAAGDAAHLAALDPHPQYANPLAWLNIKSAPFNAKVDGKRVTDASVSGTALTSATAAFVPSDVGKSVKIENSTATTAHVTTISAYVSATAVTLALTSPFSGSSLPMVFGTDDAAAVNAAIAAAGTAGGGTVYHPGGICVIAGALQDTSRSNAQLVFPALHAVNARQVTIEVRGCRPPPTVYSVVGATPLPTEHSIFDSFLLSGGGSQPCVMGGWGPSGSFANLSMLQVVLRDFTVRMPPNPQMSAIDLSHVVSCDVDQIVVDTGNYYIQSLPQPTTSTSYAIRYPGNGNGAHTRIGTVNVSGMYWGQEFGEHSNGFQVNAWGCYKAFKFGFADHGSVFQRMMNVHCTYGLTFTGGNHTVVISQYNIERAASGWWQTTYDIDDASNFGRGRLCNHQVLAGVGAVRTFTTNGARYIDRAHNEAGLFLVTDADSVTLDLSSSQQFKWTMGGNRLLAAVTNPWQGARLSVLLVQDGTGSRILDYGSQFLFTNGAVPTLTTTANAVDWLQGYYDEVAGGFLCTLTPNLSPLIVAALDPANTNAGLTLTNSRRTCNRNAGGASLVTSFTQTAHASGKWYFEVRIDSMSGATNFQIHGVAPVGTANTAHIGTSANGYGYYAQTGQKFNNNTGASYGTAYAAGDIIQVALDLTNGRIFFGKNNTWQASGDPVGGTNPAYSGISGNFLGGVSLYNGSSTPYDVVTVRLKLADMTYTPPTGYSAWQP